jgi:HD-GYP domain-containing protein (c-di-GMP phosphodiesterase class II)
MKADSILTAQSLKFMPVYLDSLRIDSVPDFDLYVKRDTGYVLYRSSQMPFDENTRSSLLGRQIRKLYISITEQTNYQKYIEQNINSIIKNTSIDEHTKAIVLYNTTRSLVMDILNDPALSENIKRGQNIVESTVYYILNEKNAFRRMLEVMTFDYYTYTHSVNVCAFSIALAQYAGINDPKQLNQLGIGALLHDVGKTKVPASILNKKGSLTPEEFEIIKNHPQWGFGLIKETNITPQESYYTILQHHERENGTGYPHGIGADEIHHYGKIAAIADAFDAMTTQRIYREAKTSFQACEELSKEKGAYNWELLERFISLLGPHKMKYGKVDSI